MSTRSVVAVPNGDGWKGRYCHHDGYPTGVGMALYAIASRDGVQQAVKTLTEDYSYWSTINASPEDTRASWRRDGDPGGFVPGYGEGSNEADRSRWITHDDDAWGAEWAYVLCSGGLMVIKGDYDGNWRSPVIVPWGIADVSDVRSVLAGIENGARQLVNDLIG